MLALPQKLNNPRMFEEAREAIIKLEALNRVLSPAELETLGILFDKHATGLIAKSLQETERRTYEPIAKILQMEELYRVYITP
jgi:hypothetical protein